MYSWQLLLSNRRVSSTEARCEFWHKAGREALACPAGLWDGRGQPCKFRSHSQGLNSCVLQGRRRRRTALTSKHINQGLPSRASTIGDGVQQKTSEKRPIYLGSGRWGVGRSMCSSTCMSYLQGADSRTVRGTRGETSPWNVLCSDYTTISH